MALDSEARGWSGRFRPDLEGLRAVAVILVLLYHTGMHGFGGGYVGVDVFFVLSGFLITGLIHRELSATGGFSLTKFYARRARRLLPAAAIVLIVTLVASVIILPAFRLPSVQADIASAGLYISNVRFGIQANDYFEASADPSPILHFWSLSVEEQFYIVWPALIVALYAWLPNVAVRGRRVGLGIAGIALASLLASIWLTAINQPWAFYLLPTRAWELAVGGLVAVGIGRLARVPPQAAAMATVVGVVCVVVAAISFSDATPFPGLAALLPVAGAVLVIVGGVPEAAPLPARLLGVGPLRYLGRISYSLYLWHWPVLVLGAIVLGPGLTIPLALLAILLAAASQRWVEEPLRRGRFIGTLPRRNLLQAAGVGLVVLVMSAAITGISGRETRAAVIPPAGSQAIGTPGPTTASPTDLGPRPCTNCTVEDLAPPLSDLFAGRIPDGQCDTTDAADCVFGDPAPTAPVVALFGDSHAGNWSAVLAQLATTHGWRLVHLTHSGCPSILAPVWNKRLNRVNPECDEWRDLAIARLETERPDVILVANREQHSMVDAGGAEVAHSYPLSPSWAQLWSAGLDRLLGRLTTVGGTIVVMGDTPVPRQSGVGPSCIAKEADFRTCQAQRTEAAPPDVHDVDRLVAAKYGALFLDPTPWFCNEEHCPAVIDRFVVYADGQGHLTTAFTLSLADRLLAALPIPPRN